MLDNGIIRIYNKYIDFGFEVYNLIFVPVRIWGWVGGFGEILTI